MAIFLLCMTRVVVLCLNGVQIDGNDISRATRIVAFDKSDKVAIAMRESFTSVGVTAYDLTSGEELLRYSCFGAAASFGAASNSKYLLLGGVGNPVLFDLVENAQWRPTIDPITLDAHFLSSGNSFIVNDGATLFECKVASKTVSSLRPFRSVTPIRMIDSARDAESIMILAEELGFAKQTIWSWDLKSPPKELAKVGQVGAIALASDGKMYAVSDVKNGKPIVVVADAASGEPVFEIGLPRHQTFLQFSHDTKWLVCSCIAGGPVRVYSLVSKELVKEFDDVSAYPSFVSASAKLVLFRPATNTVVIYDMNTDMQTEVALKPKL
jgi:hypothetical protein